MDFSFFRKRKVLWLSIAGALVFLVLSILGGRIYLEYRASLKQPVPVREREIWKAIEELTATAAEQLREPEPEPERVSWLDGQPLPDDVEPSVVSVIIENHPTSRAQMRGLHEASIIIEALTEGGITRFLAIFDTSELKKVGPVRSARPYFVDWAEELGGAFAHAGGSVAALEQLQTSNLLDFDEDGETLYRDFRYLKPHNLFVNLAAVRESLDRLRWDNNLAEPWFDFSGEIPAAASPVKEFSLDFSLPSYYVDYVYDPASGDYQRLVGGVEHTSNSDEVRPRNIIVQFTEYWPIDDIGRLDLRTTGEDVAWYFSGGKYWQGTWRKSGGRTHFLGQGGQSVRLQPGQTFIEILDNSTRVKLPQTETIPEQRIEQSLPSTLEPGSPESGLEN